MRLPRTSIAALMGIVLLLAVAFAALARPTPLWAAIAFSGVMVALTFSLLAMIILRGPSRLFWLGFFVGGSSYLFLQYGPYCDEHVGPYTLPHAVLDLTWAALHPGAFPEFTNGVVTVATPPPLPPSATMSTLPPGVVPAPPALPPDPSPFAIVPGSAPAETDSSDPSPYASYPSAPSGATLPPQPVTGPGAFPQLVSPNMTTFSGRSAAWAYWSTDAVDSGSPNNGTTPAFFRIGHSFLSLLVAIVFGLVARRLGERRVQAAEALVTDSAPAVSA